MAGAYAEHRPDYAQAAVRWALEPAPGMRVLEPDRAMRTELRRALPAVRSLPGSADAIPLRDGSVDAVLAGNALHWFRHGHRGI